jgi:hypothetical protein
MPHLARFGVEPLALRSLCASSMTSQRGPRVCWKSVEAGQKRARSATLQPPTAMMQRRLPVAATAAPACALSGAMLAAEDHVNPPIGPTRSTSAPASRPSER